MLLTETENVMSNIHLDDDDVVSTTAEYGLGNTFTVGELKSQIQSLLREGTEDCVVASDKCAWFTLDGTECEVLLQDGGGWRRGKVRFQLEFIPDNPE